MASARQLVLVALAIALAAVTVSSSPYYGGYDYYRPGNYAVSTNKSHNLIIGNRQPGDRLVYQENVIKSSKWLQEIVETRTYNVSNYYAITQISALDQKTNGNGAIASRLAGGPGYSNVTLKFKSKRSHGINFIVQIYAKPRY